MRQSQLFTKTKKEAPKDEVSKNAELLLRAGYIHKEMAGVYAYLPLGLRVLEKIKDIVREEMRGLGALEIVMTSLQRKELWEETGRWSDEVVDVWFKSTLHAGGEVGFGWSHEEPIAHMLKNHISSFRDLPVYVHQFQTKLRNELRAKSGVMRGREFVMNDMYSFDINEASHTAFYNSVIDAYHRVFRRVGIGEDTFVTYAAGGAFTQFSHEFQTITDAGEDVIYINREKKIAINKEVLNNETLEKLGVRREELDEVVTAEVGNIFNFGTEKSERLGLTYKSEDGREVPVWMGSYGIGVTRLLGVLVEKFSDAKGIIWPTAVAPFTIHLVDLSGGSKDVGAWAQDVYTKLTERHVEVLYDDRDLRAGEKFADSDLIGIPYRCIVSERNLESKHIEVVERATGATAMIPLEQLLSDRRFVVAPYA